MHNKRNSLKYQCTYISNALGVVKLCISEINITQSKRICITRNSCFEIQLYWLTIIITCLLDIISHIRRLILPNGIKTQGSAHYLINRLSMIKLPGTIHKKYELSQMDDLPQSSAFLKLLRSCLLAAVSLKLQYLHALNVL